MAQARSGQGARPKRPLSPHLQIHAMPINMLMSILHRITGSALYFGTLLLALWLISAATGPEYFDLVSSWFDSWFGRFVLIGYTWALLHHMLGGLRHFIWDMARGHDLETVDQLSWATGALSLAGTAAIWFAVLS